ncbi:DUF4097 family beta strand repeat-containing protein [Dactylosporangium sp. CS-033363]|uniref:DUF4097 family beta strand repeat-containing protein n=1 Tax=Dactylosporangium sp. CS-033363 TaxID=3239935 RepID=UPI003D8D3E32
MKSRTYTAAASGCLMVDVRVPAGSVRVIVEDRDHAEVTIIGPDADVIDRTRFAESFQQLSVHVPDSPAQPFGGPIHIAGGNVGMVAGVVYGSLIMHGNAHQTTGMVFGGVAASGTDIDIRLPPSSSLCVETVAASVDVTGPLLTAYVQSTSGAIRLDTVAGPQLETVSGRVTVADLIGIGSIETVSGDITVTSTAPSELNARSVSGNIRAVGPIRLAAHTVSGRVRTY